MKKSLPIFKIFISIFVLLILVQCKQINNVQKIEGEFLQTPYTIQFIGENSSSISKQSIDTILTIINNTFSIENPNSKISEFNKTGKIKIENEYLRKVLAKNSELYELTNGAFDPTIGKMIEIWGVNFENIDNFDSVKVKETVQLIGFDKINITKDSLIATKNGMVLDLGATYKGFAVDVLAEFLESKNINNYNIDMEWGTRTKGKNGKKDWLSNKKSTSSDTLISKINQVNYSVANSSYHQRFYNRKGVKFAYTINPKTGYPSESNILSAQIITSDCMTANALSTACMALGFEKAKELTQKLPTIKFIITYTNGIGETISYNSF